MVGGPKIIFANLNGVNDQVRDQYQGKPLAAMNIPRHLVCSPKGEGYSDFELSLNEVGEVNHSLKRDERLWLQARAMVDHWEEMNKDESQQAQDGLQLLLRDLVPGHIKKGDLGG
jgi:hypothetical protein